MPGSTQRMDGHTFASPRAAWSLMWLPCLEHGRDDQDSERRCSLLSRPNSSRKRSLQVTCCGRFRALLKVENTYVRKDCPVRRNAGTAGRIRVRGKGSMLHGTTKDRLIDGCFISSRANPF
ncbi:hypothetical protein VPH35_033876 [Triticum aestivum]